MTLILLCAACAQEPSNTPAKVDLLIVPTVKQYTRLQQAQVAMEMEQQCFTPPPKAPMMCEMINDYGRMRDAARAARGQKVDINR